MKTVKEIIVEEKKKIVKAITGSDGDFPNPKTLEPGNSWEGPKQTAIVLSKIGDMIQEKTGAAVLGCTLSEDQLTFIIAAGTKIGFKKIIKQIGWDKFFNLNDIYKVNYGNEHHYNLPAIK